MDTHLRLAAMMELIRCPGCSHYGDYERRNAVAGDGAGRRRIARAKVTPTKAPAPSLYRALSATGNPELSTLLKVLKALGLRLSVEPAELAAA